MLWFAFRCTAETSMMADRLSDALLPAGRTASGRFQPVRSATRSDTSGRSRTSPYGRGCAKSTDEHFPGGTVAAHAALREHTEPRFAIQQILSVSRSIRRACGWEHRRQVKNEPVRLRPSARGALRRYPGCASRASGYRPSHAGSSPCARTRASWSRSASTPSST